MRKDFEMTKDQFDKIVAASQPTRVMKIGNSYPSTPQENANRAWMSLGKEMGFDGMSVKPKGSSNPRQFTAEAVDV